MIRHVAIQYHLVRCMAMAGDVDVIFCVTEDQIADLFTKNLIGGAYDRLSPAHHFDFSRFAFSHHVSVNLQRAGELLLDSLIGMISLWLAMKHGA